jgi:NAD(P)-dependent dehydrogenase (short-subunit alcohol dehydrogenase family)
VGTQGAERVSLGWVRTEAMLAGDRRPEGHGDPSDDIPVGRMGTPEEIGGICVFLAADAAPTSTATIWADGGGGF